MQREPIYVATQSLDAKGLSAACAAEQIGKQCGFGGGSGALPGIGLCDSKARFRRKFMFCPECKAEYRPGFTHCVDCDVDLVEELPRSAIELRRTGENGEYRVAGEPGDPNEDPFCSFWKGDDARVHAELSAVLDDAGIPYHTVFRQDHLFNFKNYPVFEVGVPFSLFERAENAVKQAYGTDSVANVGSQELQLLAHPAFRPRRELPLLAPGQAENNFGPSNVGEETDWFPEDATVKVWSVDGNEIGDFLVAALHENGIHCRLDQNSSRVELYVLPEDEKRAREIVREVVEGAPPE